VSFLKNSDCGTKLFMLKLIHTVIWCVLAAAVFCVLYAGIFDKVNILVWVCAGMVFLEGIILLVCKWKCPLTIVGYKYTDDPKTGFDIFLPAWLTKHNTAIFALLFAVGLALVFWRELS